MDEFKRRWRKLQDRIRVESRKERWDREDKDLSLRME